jgi:hypothetical protein
VFDDERTAEELARLRRRDRIRRLVVIIVVVAMIVALVVPLIVRTVRRPSAPDGIVALHAPVESRRMIV